MSQHTYGYEKLHARPVTPDVDEKSFQRLQSAQRDLSVERIQKIIRRVKPAKWHDGSLRVVEVEDPVGVSYIWNDPTGDLIENPQVLAQITTLHSHGYYGLFKPTIKEVLDGTPPAILRVARAFTTFGPVDRADLSRQWDAVNHCTHVAVTVFYM